VVLLSGTLGESGEKKGGKVKRSKFKIYNLQFEICNIAKRYAEPCQQKPLAYKVIWRQGDKITSPVG